MSFIKNLGLRIRIWQVKRQHKEYIDSFRLCRVLASRIPFYEDLELATNRYLGNLQDENSYYAVLKYLHEFFYDYWINELQPTFQALENNYKKHHSLHLMQEHVDSNFKDLFERHHAFMRESIPIISKMDKKVLELMAIYDEKNSKKIQIIVKDYLKELMRFKALGIKHKVYEKKLEDEWVKENEGKR